MDMRATTAKTRGGSGAAATLGAALLIAAAAATPFLVARPLVPWTAGVLVAGAVIVLIVFAITSRRARRLVEGDAEPVAPAPADPAPDELRRQLETLRHTQAELLRAKQTAEAATMAKGEFLATMSHEIRTPLNGILPLLDLVLSTNLAADQRDYLATAYQSARDLLRIVDAILDYSKLDAERLELETVGLNLRELVDGVAELMQQTAESKGLRLGVTIDANVRLAVRGDPVRLRQVLTNLVSNAIKFTERGGVQIHVSKRGETRDRHEIVFAVRDSGIGIAPDAVQRLFRPFSQADASTTRVFGGTGLGLAICKRLVDLMHGRIGVKSEPGRGSLFWFSVPLLKAIGDVAVRRDLNGIRGLALIEDEALLRRTQVFAGALGMELAPSDSTADALARLRAAAAMGEKWRLALLVVEADAWRGPAAATIRTIMKDASLAHVRVLAIGGGIETDDDPAVRARFAGIATGTSDDALRSTLERLFGIEAPPSARDEAAAAVAGPVAARQAESLSGRVLLVEDNAVNRRVAEKLLALHGLEVVAVENGREAIDALAKARFDIVLMDCLMPVMDGFTAARSWREHEREHGGHVPIVAMTANAMVGDRERCLESGMDDYMTKPLDRALLQSMLQRWIEAGSKQPRPIAASVPAPVPHVRADAAAGSAPTPARRALDAAILSDLIDTMGEEFGELVRVYLEDAPRRIDELDAAANAHDAAGQVSPAHTLKSSSANIGATALSEMARRIEHAARGGAFSSREDIADGVRQEYRQVEAELGALLARAAR